MSNKENTEKIFKNQFKDFKQTPSNSVWSKIEKKMLFKHFMKYKALSFNIWNVTVIAAIIVSAVLILGTNNKTSEISNLNTPAINTVNTSEQLITDNKINTQNQLSEIKQKTTKKLPNIKNTNYQKSENQISDKKKVELIPNRLLKENYANSKSNNEGKITVKLAEPHSDFSVSTTSACEPAAIAFLNTSENCDSYHWDFGNGETSFQKNPNFVFKTAGTFNVTLTVTSGRLSDLMSKKITVYPKPNTDFKIRNKADNLYTGEEIEFSNISTGFSHCIWNFGDNNTSNYTNPSHIYDEEGNYRISLICISEKKCADTAYLSNVVIQDKKYKINFPTAFSPDKSGQNNGYWRNSIYPNSIFHPVSDTQISKYHLNIYNKYGILIFESNDFEIGWNGFYKNAPAPSAVYVWECSGKFEDGKIFREKGNLTLLYLRNQ